jgi:hypothetical protein
VTGDADVRIDNRFSENDHSEMGVAHGFSRSFDPGFRAVTAGTSQPEAICEKGRNGGHVHRVAP